MSESNENDSNKSEKNNKNINKYLAQIEQLENEIALEKSINNSLNIGAVTNNNDGEEEISKLKEELDFQNSKLIILKNTNKKQNKALIDLSKKLKIDQDNKKIPKKSNESNEAVNIVLKVKEKELACALNKMNILKKQNDSLKKDLYKNNQFAIKMEISDNSKEKSEILKNLDNELNTLNKQLTDHIQCLEERQKMSNEYNELKNELKSLKKGTQENKNKIRETENKLNDKFLMHNKLKSINNSNTVNKKKNYSNLLSSTNKTRHKKSSGNINNKIILPLITNNIQPSSTPNKTSTLLTNSFIEKIQNYFENNHDECDTLIYKIKEIENSSNTIQNKHYIEIKKFNKQISTLDEQFQLLNNEGKNTNSNIRVLKNKLNITKGEVRNQIKKLQELKKEYDDLDEVSKNKDYEITLLLGQINSLKQLAKYGGDKSTSPDEELIEKCIEKIKEQQKNGKKGIINRINNNSTGYTKLEISSENRNNNMGIIEYKYKDYKDYKDNSANNVSVGDNNRKKYGINSMTLTKNRNRFNKLEDKIENDN